MKFIVDRMLGRLTRWLRLSGYDTTEIRKQENEDELLLLLAKEEGRILLSRDRLLIQKAKKNDLPSYLVRSPDILEQLREIKEEFKIRFEPEMDRCNICNSLIRKAEPSETDLIKEKEYIYPSRLEAKTGFWICDNCGQVYWQGKHWANIKETLNKLRNG